MGVVLLGSSCSVLDGCGLLVQKPRLGSFFLLVASLSAWVGVLEPVLNFVFEACVSCYSMLIFALCTMSR